MCKILPADYKLKMEFNKVAKLLLSIIICELAGVIGAVFTGPVSIGSWYKNLNKPFFNPPGWIFGPVWTAIFILMGISLYLVWSKKWSPKNKIKSGKVKVLNSLSEKFLFGSWQKANIILIFILQLVLNVLWSVIFFGMHSVGLAFFELLMLWFAIVFLIVNFYRVSKTSAWLLVPYILWVTFAGILNLVIFLIN
jgi:tryptophan-rich sensory protein